MNISYLKGKAATVLCAVKMLYGIIAAIILYRGVSVAVSVIRDIIAVADKYHVTFFSAISKYMREMMKLVPIADSITDNLFAAGFGAVCSIVLLIIFVFFLVILEPILELFDMVGCISLRRNGSGWSVVKNVHFIRSLICALSIAELGVLAVRMLSYDGTMENTVKTIAIITLLILIFFGWLVYCYQRDIMKAMNVIAADIKGVQRTTKNTHLSGLSVLFGVIFLISAIALLRGLMNPSAVSDTELQESLFLQGVIAVRIMLEHVKYFMVAVCNHNLKNDKLADE